MVLSISTIEHIGMEDGSNKPDRVKSAINHIVNHLLAKDGQFVFTIPIGYNKYLDNLLLGKEISLSKEYYLLRTNKDSWVEVTKDRVLGSIYNKPFSGANGLLVGIISK